jgi:hypothetical protein
MKAVARDRWGEISSVSRRLAASSSTSAQVEAAIALQHKMQGVLDRKAFVESIVCSSATDGEFHNRDREEFYAMLNAVSSGLYNSLLLLCVKRGDA